MKMCFFQLVDACIELERVKQYEHDKVKLAVVFLSQM